MNGKLDLKGSDYIIILIEMPLDQLLYCNWNVYRCNLVDRTILNMLNKKKHKKESQYFYIYKNKWNDPIHLLDVEYFRTHQDSLREYRKEYLRLWWKDCFYMLLCRYSNMKVYISNQTFNYNNNVINFPLSNSSNYTDSYYYGDNEKNIKFHDIDNMKNDNFLKEYEIDPCYKKVNNEWVRIRYNCFCEFSPDWMNEHEFHMINIVKFIDCKIDNNITIRIYDPRNTDIIKILPEDTNNELFLLEALFYLNCGELHMLEFKDGEVINID